MCVELSARVEEFFFLVILLAYSMRIHGIWGLGVDEIRRNAIYRFVARRCLSLGWTFFFCYVLLRIARALLDRAIPVTFSLLFEGIRHSSAWSAI